MRALGAGQYKSHEASYEAAAETAKRDAALVGVDPSSLSAVLTGIQVSMATLGGKIDTLNARLEGRLEAQEDEVARLRDELNEERGRAATTRRRVGDLERFQSRLIGVAVGAGLASSGATVALVEAISRFG